MVPGAVGGHSGGESGEVVDWKAGFGGCGVGGVDLSVGKRGD